MSMPIKKKKKRGDCKCALAMDETWDSITLQQLCIFFFKSSKEKKFFFFELLSFYLFFCSHTVKKK